MKKIVLILCSMFLFNAANAAVDSGLVSKAEKYLNSITGLNGSFDQVSNGKKDNGIFSMLRPGRVRLDYKTIPIQLISNGKDLYFYDKSLDQITTLPLTSTPAGILVRKNIDLVSSDIEVSETKITGDSFWIKMNIKGQEGVGFMNVEFQKSPVALKSWIVHDATGTNTSVAFNGMKIKTDFSKNYFQLQKMKAANNSNGDTFYE